MTRILVVEDELGIALALEDDLTSEGYDVDVVGDGQTASERARQQSFDLILLDVMLPGKDGFDVCREVRRTDARTPIIILTAKTQEAEKVLGLELGADDYITKPYSPRELRARIKAALRRAAGEQPEVYRFGDAEVDFARCELASGRAGGRSRPPRVQVVERACAPPGPRLDAPAVARRGVGPRDFRHRPRGGQPGDEPAQED